MAINLILFLFIAIYVDEEIKTDKIIQYAKSLMRMPYWLNVNEGFKKHHVFSYGKMLTNQCI